MADVVKIGPTFGAELIAAGLGNLPISWSSDGTFVGRDALSAAQNSALDAVIAAHKPVALPVPQAISDRQFFQQLAIAGIITQDQALAANAAVIPAPLLSIINAMPADQQFGVKMMVSGETTFQRTNPVTIAIGTAYGMTSEQMDAFFVAAAVL